MVWIVSLDSVVIPALTMVRIRFPARLGIVSVIL